MANTEHRPLTSTRPWLRRAVIIASIAYLVYYIWWRATQTLNPDAFMFSWLVLLAESFGVINFILFYWMTADVTPTRYYSDAIADLSVDVFVPTYNEDASVLEPTLVGCQGIAYPHTTYVLDDGNRREIAELAAAYGCKYFARERNTDAKAGNLNNALEHSSGEFIAILDADMVPQPDFLHRTLGYFKDPLLAFVQLPQEFYNEDSIQHHSKKTDVKLWHEQSLFFRVIQPGKNHSNSAFWTGSPSVLRRKALESIGGIATATVTEDIHTSVRLHASGWNSLFLSETLAYGLAPETIHAFLLQRLRWAQGTMQLYRSKESPFWISGLSLKQRLSYFASFRAYIESIQKIILLLTPAVILLFSILPMRVNASDFFLHWAPYFLITLWANEALGRGYFRYFQTEKFNLLKMLTFLNSFIALLPIKISFKVTPKSAQDTDADLEVRSMYLYIALFLLILIATIAGITQLETLLLAGEDPGLIGIALIWAVFNTGMIVLALEYVLTKKHRRETVRFTCDAPATLTKDTVTITGRVQDISATGAMFALQSDRELIGGNWQLSIPASSTMPPLELPTSIIVQTPLKGSLSIVGVRFRPLEADVRSKLFKYLYVMLPAQKHPDNQSVT